MLSVIQLFLFFSCNFNKIYIILLQLCNNTKHQIRTFNLNPAKNEQLWKLPN